MKRRILLISPHPDDVVLSLGCMVDKFVQYFDIYIWDVFTVKKYNKAMMNCDETTENVRKEEFEVWKNSGIHIVYDNFVDAQLRYHCRASQVMDGNVLLKKAWREEREILNEIGNKYLRLIRQIRPRYVGIPLGIGQHIDHLIVRKLVLEVEGSHRIFLYEDMPYSMTKKWYEKAYKEMIQTMCVTEYTFFFSIDDICKKICLLKKYESQFTPHEIKLIEQYISRKKFERIWIVKKQEREDGSKKEITI